VLGGLWRSFSGLGALVGALCFAAALTPSLIPRTVALQGALGGVAFACGYGIGVLLLWTWEWLELPLARDRIRQVATWSGGGTVVVALWRWVDWQNSVRLLMGMEPLEAGDPTRVGLIAASVALVLILLVRLFNRTGRLVANPLQRVAPRRVSKLVGLLVAALVFALLRRRTRASSRISRPPPTRSGPAAPRRSSAGRISAAPAGTMWRRRRRRRRSPPSPAAPPSIRCASMSG
jgi:uncharacterized membrane protein